MSDLYDQLIKKDGQDCFTLTHNIPAKMYIDEKVVTIEYRSGGNLEIPRSMVIEAIRRLEVKGVLTLEDVHEGITHKIGPITDRLLAILRELPGVTFTSRPRTLYLKK